MKVNYTAESEMLRVIAHPVRLMILEELCKGAKCVTDVERLLAATRQPNISQHLALLRHCKIVDFQQQGKRRCYFVTNPEMISGLLTLLGKQCASKPLIATKETVG
jgi:ArsR family transcriptional regulator